MTEEEAKTKRCCGSSTCGEVRPVDAESRWIGPYPNFCIGSACMAWRWCNTGTSVQGGAPAHHTRWVGLTNSGLAVLADGNGYCGLAEQP